MKFEINGISAYLPIYLNYFDAMNDYPNEPIHAINLTELKS